MAGAPESLTASEARVIALNAQGFGDRAPAKVTARHVLAAASRVHALQVDTVNVLVRAHYLPLYSRLGPYPIAALDRLTNESHDLVEDNAHQASYVPAALVPLLAWRHRELFRHSLALVGHDETADNWRGWWRKHVDAAYAADIEQQVVERGPLALNDLTDARRRPKPTPEEAGVRRRDGKPYAESSLRWGMPSDGKRVLDGLLYEGRLALAGRRGAERLYDLAERVLPAEVLNTPPLSAVDAQRELVRLAARALGLATIADLANYFLTKTASARVAVNDLVAEGALLPVRVEGWKEPAYLDARASSTPVDAHRLIGPFDSLTWSRDRVRRLFGYEFSFEIYLPAAKRRYGYYVLPFLLGDELVARVDLKADRGRSTLVVPGAYAEPGRPARAIVPHLVAELRVVADWLGLEDVESGRAGDLGRHLR